MTRQGKRSRAVLQVLKESEENLWSAWKRSNGTKQAVLKGDGRAKEVLAFLEKRLPATYGLCFGTEIVDFADARSGETDIVIYDKARNCLLSEKPNLLPAEALLAVIEVKSRLTKAELRKCFASASTLTALRPFKKRFRLAPRQTRTDTTKGARCFKTVFAFTSDLKKTGWLNKEWARLKDVAATGNHNILVIDRLLVLDRGLINPIAMQGATEVTTPVLNQWFIHLMNFLERENKRRKPVDWQMYTVKKIPGWEQLP
jgi:hypothetical protein